MRHAGSPVLYPIELIAGSSGDRQNRSGHRTGVCPTSSPCSGGSFARLLRDPGSSHVPGSVDFEASLAARQRDAPGPLDRGPAGEPVCGLTWPPQLALESGCEDRGGTPSVAAASARASMRHWTELLAAGGLTPRYLIVEDGKPDRTESTFARTLPPLRRMHRARRPGDRYPDVSILFKLEYVLQNLRG